MLGAPFEILPVFEFTPTQILFCQISPAIACIPGQRVVVSFFNFYSNSRTHLLLAPRITDLSRLYHDHQLLKTPDQSP